jgi:hypothetical protein
VSIAGALSVVTGANPSTFSKPYHGLQLVAQFKGEGTPRKLAIATQPQFPRKIADFKHAIGFQISRCKLKKLTFD